MKCPSDGTLSIFFYDGAGVAINCRPRRGERQLISCVFVVVIVVVVFLLLLLLFLLLMCEMSLRRDAKHPFFMMKQGRQLIGCVVFVVVRVVVFLLLLLLL